VVVRAEVVVRAAVRVTVAMVGIELWGG